MERNVSASAEALKEISKEKARIFGKKVKASSVFEQAALMWKKNKEVKEGQRQQEMLRREEVLGLCFHRTIAKEVVDADIRKLANLSRADSTDEAGWIQFDLWTKEPEGKKAKQIPLNMATVVAIRKKLIAEEWRRAKGTKKRNPRIDILEREASTWGRKREEERLRQDKAKAKFEQQKSNVEEILKIVGPKILGEKDNLTVEKCVALIEDAFGAAGKVYDVEWREDGCDIWIEPWGKRWSRQNGEVPTIYKIRVNDELGMVSYDLVEDEEAEQKVKEEMLASRLEQLDESVDEERLGADEDDGDIITRLERKIEDVGRLIELKEAEESTWLAIIEPWDEMRIRNIERKGDGPIECESIVAKVVDGTIITSVIKGDKSWERQATEWSPADSGAASEFELGTAPQK